MTEKSHPAVNRIRKRFETIPLLKEKSTWIESHPLEWNKRLYEFDRTIQTVNDMLNIPELASPEYHADFFDLQKKLGNAQLPNLSTMLDKMKLRGESKNPEVRIVTSAFNTIKNQMGEGGDWHWVTEISDPFQAFSGLLIEGYGLALSYLYDGDPKLKSEFVKTFKEVLWTQEQDSLLLKDVLPWMIEEKKDFPKRVNQELGNLHYGRKWGDFRVWGDDQELFYDKSSKEQRDVLAWSQSCPQPNGVSDAFGVDWTIRRYAENNLWTGYIVDKIGETNQALFEQLNRIYKRPKDESIGNFEKDNVPDLYPEEFGLMGTPWGYALSRVLIEQFGRGEERSNQHIDKGLSILDKVIKQSKTPQELLARLANETVKADASIEAVLGHVFAVEMKGEGKMFLLKCVVTEMKKHAPALWKSYMLIPDENYSQLGIISSKDLLT